MAKIVSANIHDFADILAIQQGDGFNHAYSLTEDRYRRLLKRGEMFFLAYVSDRAVGMASIDFEIRATLHFLSVLVDYQRGGVGSTLLAAIVAEARKRGYAFIDCCVEAGSLLEAFLYTRDFKQVGFYEDRYGQGRPGQILCLKL